MNPLVPTAFRDGVFSQADPMARYQASYLQAYSDGSLGRTRRRSMRGLGMTAGSTAAVAGIVLLGVGLFIWSNRK